MMPFASRYPVTKLTLLPTLLLFSTVTAHAATITAANCSSSAVQSAVNSAQNGDTVVVPNGSCTWTSGVTISGKAIALQGASVGGVTITHGAGSGTLITVTPGGSSHMQIANLRFLPGSATGVYIQMNSGGQVPLMHDVYFNQPDFQLINSILWFRANGVIWNMTIESTTVHGTGGSNGSGSGGLKHRPTDGTWNQASSMGTLDTNGDRNLYIEDSTFIDVYNSVLDLDDDARTVVRHNIVRNSQFVTHGTTSLRGGRLLELYDNAFQYRTHAPNGSGITAINLNRYYWARANTFVVTGNSFEHITSGDWGSRTEIVWTAESLTRAGAGAGCQTAYPGTHWPGFGANGSAQVSDPIYIWNNTGTLAVGGLDQPDTCGSGLQTRNFILSGRDYFLNAGAKPGYAKYAYPHPLRSSSSGSTPPAAPTGFAVVR